MADHFWLVLATLIFLGCSGWGLYALGSRKSLGDRWTFGLTLGGFVFQTLFLFFRGETTKHCPIGNLFETLAFFTWSFVLTYLLVGSTYRMSILGAFTAPAASLINFIALTVAVDSPSKLPDLGWRLEMHATLALLGLGILGIAAMAGIAYLIQDRQLKQRSLGTWFYRLPPIDGLERVQYRVLFLGFCIFTLGAAMGFSLPHSNGEDWVKIVWSGLVCLLYASVLAILTQGYLSQKKAAWLSICSYGFILLTWLAVNSLSTNHMFSGSPLLSSNGGLDVR